MMFTLENLSPAAGIGAMGAFFVPARCMIWEDIDHIMQSFGGDTEARIIYHNDDMDVVRVYKQTHSSGKILECRIMYIAQRIIDDVCVDEYIVTHGCIRTSDRSKVLEYEKVGKRKLYEATKELWGISY